MWVGKELKKIEKNWKKLGWWKTPKDITLQWKAFQAFVCSSIHQLVKPKMGNIYSPKRLIELNVIQRTFADRFGE